jgi:6-phosphogluconolactonase
MLTLLNSQPTNGKGTTHVDVDPTRSCAVTANYTSGDISVLPINPDGTLAPVSAVIKHTGSSINPDRQRHPFPHSCNFDPSGKFVLVPDLGVDKVYVYRFDAGSKSLTEIDPAHVTPGSGPRHLSFHPNGKFVYLINEMGGTVTVFGWDGANGRLNTLQTISTLPPDYKGLNTSAEVHLLSNGRFLYASNRGPNDLAIFAVDPGTGMLTLKGFESTGGKGPRDFDIDPTGNYLIAANQDSDSVLVFRINQETGGLTAIGDKLLIPSPICVTFVPVAE